LKGTEPSTPVGIHPRKPAGQKRSQNVRRSIVDNKKASVDNDAIESEVPNFAIVGVGASAGGLEALGALFQHFILDSAAFVVVQHLAPDHESILTELLARSSKMRVLTAENGMKTQPGHIYVIPPNADLALLHGVLHLLPLQGQRPHLPIDSFFRSLAEDWGSRAIGVILSGTGTDGTLGLRSIKAAGGITFVQEPSSAKYEGMPRSALDSGSADFCLNPEAIANELARICGHRFIAKSPDTVPYPPEHLARLFLLIRTTFGLDLTCYKQGTIERRVDRRMALHKIERLDDYLKLCQSNVSELAVLFKDVLINVTRFFRDPDVFELLKKSVFPPLIEQKGTNGAFRLWVPGCATGEEAYSMAICLLESLEAKAQDFKLQIFGTDVDIKSIEQARSGVYPESIALDVSPERLLRFFVRKHGEYHIAQRIRDLVIFSTQNAIKDPPFSRLDLVSCRNLLIYLQPAIQKKVLKTFHHALNPNAFLLLGTSETVADSSDLFSLIDRRNKIYSKKQTVLGLAPGHGAGAFPTLANFEPASSAPSAKQPSLQQLADRKVLEEYGSPGVIINQDFEILQFRGRTGSFLEPTPGVASLNLLKLARPELHFELPRAIRKALRQHGPVRMEAKSRVGNGTRNFTLEVLPIEEPGKKTPCLLVLFKESSPPKHLRPKGKLTKRDPDHQRIHELKQELLLNSEYLQSTIGELEVTNEELQSSNEELQSSNEELQSTNEELETSKEELQAINEELTTVNDELKNRMSELHQTNDDLHNLLLNVDTAVIIVGMDSRIRRFTHASEALLNLGPKDLGRPVGCLNSFLGALSMEKVVTEVIEKISSFDQEVLCVDQRWHGLRVYPYKTLDHTIRGAVIVISDIDLRKRNADLRRDVATYAGEFLRAIQHPLMILDAKWRVVWVNSSFHTVFQTVSEEVIGGHLSNVAHLSAADPKLLELLAGTLASGTPFRNHKIEGRSAPEKVSLNLSGSRLPVTLSESGLILLSLEADSVVAPTGWSDQVVRDA